MNRARRIFWSWGLLVFMVWAPCRAESDIERPAALNKTVTADDGQKIRYRVYGTGQETIIFVHGWMCDQSYWERQVADFSRDFRVVTMDLPGHGASDATRKDWSIEAFGDDVAHVVADLKPLSPVILVGHSMGGPVIVEAAKKLKENVRLLVGVDTMKRPHMVRDPQMVAQMFAEMEKDFGGFTKKYVRQRYFHENSSPALAQRVADDMAQGPVDIAVALVSSLNAYDEGGGLAAVADTPFVFINSAQNNMDYNDLLGSHPLVKIIELEGVKHFLMMEDPVQFNAVLRSQILLVTGGIREISN